MTEQPTHTSVYILINVMDMNELIHSSWGSYDVLFLCGLIPSLASTLTVTDGILVSDSLQTPCLGSNKKVKASAVLRTQMRFCSSDHVVSIILFLTHASGVHQKQATSLTWVIPNRPSTPSAKPGEGNKNTNFGNNLIFKTKKKKEEEEIENRKASK